MHSILAAGLSAQVMDLLQAVDRGGDALVARLEPQGQIERIVPRLVQIAAVKPELSCGFGAEVGFIRRPLS
jgi:hypothetical protein